MPRTALVIRSFNGGELSPRLSGRVDLGAQGTAYLASAKVLENFLPLVQGPFMHRSGFRFVREVKDSADTTALIPFTVSTLASYVIEAGDLYFRFYTSENRLEVLSVPVELVTTYAQAHVHDLQYAQSADTLYIVHPSYPPRKLTRVTATSFAISNVDFLDGPYLDENIDTTKTLNASAATGAITITAVGHAPFLAGRDEGRHIRIENGGTLGWAQITSVTSTTVVNATVRSVSIPAGAAHWQWRLGAWYVGNYPRTVTFYEQRLWFGGAPGQIQRVDGSMTGDFERFSPTGSVDDTGGVFTSDDVFDDNAIAYTIGSNELNAVLWMRVHHTLVLGTSQSLFTVAASSLGEAITPTNISVKEEDMTGAAEVLPGRLANTILFAGRGGRTLQSAGISIEEDGGVVASDVTELADHIASSDFKQIQVARDPIPLVWARTEDGDLASLTFRPTHKVFAWARHPVGGDVLGFDSARVRSIAVIPTDAQDQLWAIIERRIDGATVQYVEFLEEPFRLIEPAALIDEAFFVDSGISYDVPLTITGATAANPVVITSNGHGLSNGDFVRITKVVGMTELNNRAFKVANVAANTFELQTLGGVDIDGAAYTAYETGGEAREMLTSFSGADHLEGQTCAVLADGAVVPDVTISGGAFTLSERASHVHVGLRRAARYQSQVLEAPDPEGASMGKARSFDRIVLRLLETLGGEIGAGFDTMVPLLYRIPAMPMDAPPTLFTGDRELTFPDGYSREPRVAFRQPDPLPSTVLAISALGNVGTR